MPLEHSEIESENEKGEVPGKNLSWELADEEKRLKNMPTHGKKMGGNEFQDIRMRHPELLEFFVKADESQDFSEKEKGKYAYLKNRFLFGEITDEELEELDKNYYIPYKNSIN